MDSVEVDELMEPPGTLWASSALLMSESDCTGMIVWAGAVKFVSPLGAEIKLEATMETDRLAAVQRWIILEVCVRSGKAGATMLSELEEAVELSLSTSICYSTLSD